MEGILSILLLAGAFLACPIGMWLFGRFMMKGSGGGMACSTGGHQQTQTAESTAVPREQVVPQAPEASPETVAALQAKIVDLKRQLNQLRATGARGDGRSEGESLG